MVRNWRKFVCIFLAAILALAISGAAASHLKVNIYF